MGVVRDRRSSLRVVIDGEAVVYTERDVIEGRCLDLGRGGLAVRSTRAARAKTPVTLELYVDGQRLRIEAVIARRQRHLGDYVMGLRFAALDPDTSARIDRMIVERLAGTPHAELLRALAAHAAAAAAPPITEPLPAADRTVVASGYIVPVITGLTQVIPIDRIATVDRTVVAAPPPRIDDAGPRTEPLPRAPAPPLMFDESWFDDEVDELDELDGLDDPLGDPLDEPFDDIAEPGAPDGPLGEMDEMDEMDTAELRLREAGAHAEPEPEPTATPEPEPTATPDRTVVAPEPTLVTFASEPPAARPERTWTWVLPNHEVDGAPEPVAQQRTATMVLPSPDAEPERTATSTIPLPPPPLVGHDRSQRPAEATLPFLATLRPSQRALLAAVALLRTAIDETRGRGGPRVIVSIPHQRYRRRSGSPWNR